MRDLLSMADVAVLNLEEAQQILNTGADDPHVLLHKLKTLGPDIVVITQGADGAVALNSDGALIQVPAQSATVKNTVGAGDGFLASFVYSIATGIDIEQSMINATHVGKIICSKQEASLDKEDVFILNSESTFVRSVD
jgi:sugar/nucleoside kinase (ribokinase family)